MLYVYAIESLSAKRIYIGYTKDKDGRLKYHNSGYVKSTAKDRPWKLVAFEKVGSKDEARWMERSLKLSRGKRIKWIKMNHVKE
jgi:predicted GIY-YIG superfamily endonuclease